jgi:hypothetical protein
MGIDTGQTLTPSRAISTLTRGYREALGLLERLEKASEHLMN